MSDQSEDEIEKKLQRIRDQWIADSKARSRKVSIPAAEREQIAALTGHINVDRIAKHNGGGRVRLSPVYVRFEWWHVNSDHHSSGTYHIDRIENGHSTDYWQGTDRSDLDREIAALLAKGFRVSQFRLAGDNVDNGNKERTTNNRRRQIMAELANVKLGDQS